MTEKENRQSGDDYIAALIRDGRTDAYKISGGQHFAGWLNAHARPLLRALGRLERLAWDDALDSIKIERPVYVCGLARSGTTILLELLHGAGGFASHTYRDYPFIDVPVLWNKWQELLPEMKAQAYERAHLDGIMITPDSPEAFEEMIWMAFFSGCHKPDAPHVLTGEDGYPAFADYYKAHIRKILFVRRAGRYLAKGNYNLTRIGYLHKLFPDARFVIPVRDPAAHIASLMKQHRLFCEVEKRDPRARQYMEWAGHYEFGLNRQPIHSGDAETVRTVRACWDSGEELKGWALYWAMLHDWLTDTLEQNPGLRESVKIVDYDRLCRNPEAELRGVFDHCGADTDEAPFETLAARLHAPAYYRPAFDGEEAALIEKLTASSYRRILDKV